MDQFMSMQQIFHLEKPANLLLVGCGWFGSGLLQQLKMIPSLNVVGVVSRSPEKAVTVFENLGVHKSQITVTEKQGIVLSAPSSRRPFVTRSLQFVPEQLELDLVFESTGCVEAGFEAAMWAIERSIPFLTVNTEMDATIGWMLMRMAEMRKSLYSLESGDQPGVLANLVRKVVSFGFVPRVVGNCKGFLDTSMTPENVVRTFPGQADMFKTCSFADGSKQSFELVSLGNSFGFSIFQRGMLGPRTTKNNLIKSFVEHIDLIDRKECFVDYVMGLNGINEGGGVFAIAELKEPHPRKKQDLAYLKMGDGPYYLFFCDYHLTYMQTPTSILDALQGRITLAPRTRSLEVIAMTKREIKAGQRLDGIGGFDCYGLAEKTDVSDQERLMPLGLAKFARARFDLKRNIPISYDMVDLIDHPIVELRQKITWN